MGRRSRVGARSGIFAGPGGRSVRRLRILREFCVGRGRLFDLVVLRVLYLWFAEKSRKYDWNPQISMGKRMKAGSGFSNSDIPRGTSGFRKRKPSIAAPGCSPIICPRRSSSYPPLPSPSSLLSSALVACRPYRPSVSCCHTSVAGPLSGLPAICSRRSLSVIILRCPALRRCCLRLSSLVARTGRLSLAVTPPSLVHCPDCPLFVLVVRCLLLSSAAQPSVACLLSSLVVCCLSFVTRHLRLSLGCRCLSFDLLPAVSTRRPRDVFVVRVQS